MNMYKDNKVFRTCQLELVETCQPKPVEICQSELVEDLLHRYRIGKRIAFVQ
jgi:hypothetical protein